MKTKTYTSYFIVIIFSFIDDAKTLSSQCLLGLLIIVLYNKQLNSDNMQST